MPPPAIPEPAPKILDSHIHLWPSTATSPSNHTWMTPGHPLAKRHGIADYKAAVASSPVRPVGFIYVETDRHLPSLEPPITDEDGEDARVEELRAWAREPLEELKFLRRIVEGRGEEGDGFAPFDSSLLKGIVIFAPFHLPSPLFQRYLQIAEETLGPLAWERVVGFRYLLQGKGVEGVRAAAENESFVGNLRGIGGRVFDVGVDCQRDGVGGLEYVTQLVEKVNARMEGTRPKFVLNHLCKPPISPSPSQTSPSTTSSPNQTFPQWSSHLTTLSTQPNVSIKLSGAFNEFAPSPTPSTTPSTMPSLLLALTPYFDHVHSVFGPERVMFGSDWPVCNVGGPAGEAGNWGLWRGVVGAWMHGRMGDEERRGVWGGNGGRIYGVEVF
ncbi:hypothetical protein K458DRAFT_349594 [Lentithecium fluviatile CBS 122367]|uniref:Amidohydrolase-related domain-containing protein n=1 Tax=Lentithecium fluviatile CBS 122367 TaxID=1168545 RepID=A0A6G1IIR1_9PLEO|nr:hypothetical protein K458DRAFT_349594 [Lentithecium fluviatile CBS 122367]